MKGRPYPNGETDPEVLALPNIGPRVAERLSRIGVLRRSDLDRLGAVQAYRRMKRAGMNPSLRHDLFGLEAALLGLRLGELSRVRRQALAREALGLPETSTPIDTRTRGFVPARDHRRRSH
ncbi:MAG: TfoX/Sxy family DNA transformation protein [Myxococcota bacterium]